MSMAVDLSTPLTKQEREYLAARGLYAELERADQMSGEASPELPAGDGTGLQPVSLLTSEQQASERQRLLARLRELDAGTGDSDVEEVPEESDLPPYEQWDVKELDAELKERKLPTSGSKADKANRLYADDETRG